MSVRRSPSARLPVAYEVSEPGGCGSVGEPSIRCATACSRARCVSNSSARWSIAPPSHLVRPIRHGVDGAQTRDVTEKDMKTIVYP